MARNSTTDGPTMTLRSGCVVGKWHIAQARIRHNKSIVGDNIKFRFTDPPDLRLKPMSDVFNTPELLEKILLNLRPGFLLQNVQKVCRGFKESIDVSPTFRKRAAFAIHVSDDYSDSIFYKDDTFTFDLIPKSLSMYHRRRLMLTEFRFLFSQDNRTFESYRTMERFRRLCVFDRTPQQFYAHWGTGQKDWEVKEGGNAITFGEIFDRAARFAGGKEVSHVDIVWYDSGEQA